MWQGEKAAYVRKPQAIVCLCLCSLPFAGQLKSPLPFTLQKFFHKSPPAQNKQMNKTPENRFSNTDVFIPSV